MICAHTHSGQGRTAGELDRAALGQLVFSDTAARRRLNAATHTPVALALLLQLLRHWLWHTRCVVRPQQACHFLVCALPTALCPRVCVSQRLRPPCPVALAACQVLDMPLLVETHVHMMVSMVVVVSASPTVQVRRATAAGMSLQNSTACVAPLRHYQASCRVTAAPPVLPECHPCLCTQGCRSEHGAPSQPPAYLPACLSCSCSA